MFSPFQNAKVQAFCIGVYNDIIAGWDNLYIKKKNSENHCILRTPSLTLLILLIIQGQGRIHQEI